MPPISATSSLDAALASLAAGHNRDPFAVLGPHVEDGALVIRAFNPAARAIEVRLVGTNELHPMTRRGPMGVFEIRLPPASHAEARADSDERRRDYRLRITFPGNHIIEVDDPYRYGRVLSDFDVYLLAKALITGRTTSWARIAARSGRRPAFISRCGLPTPTVSALSATSTAGTDASTSCG
jgi:hypothetical protein